MILSRSRKKMSRLTELEEQTAIGLLARLRAQQAEMKFTPQLTSVKSGVQTYQVPEDNLWDEFDFVQVVNGVEQVTRTRAAELPGTGSLHLPKILEVTTIYTPKYQDSPVVYPYLVLSLGGQDWQPRYSPSFGLGFGVPNDGSSNSIHSVQYLLDQTDYSAKKIISTYMTNAHYATMSSDDVKLRVRFRLRSTDRGKTSVKVKLYG